MTPLIVRLPNHLGDACMSIAALDALAAAGYALTLAGRPWIRSLFDAYPWPTVALTGSRRDHIHALNAAAAGARGLLFTNSFSTALEFRLAGIAATGYARGGRSLLAERSSVTLITGPSRTADIEMTLTIGVHGPARLIVLVCDSTPQTPREPRP